MNEAGDKSLIAKFLTTSRTWSSFLLILLIICCSQQKDKAAQVIKKHQKAIGETDHIKSIATTASCSGPEGSYTTITESSFKDDYLLFKQDYAYEKSPFYAAIYSKKEGYGLDTALVSQGPLSEAIIAVLKAHEFHELMLQVDKRYYRPRSGEDTTYFKAPCKFVKAMDHLGYPVRLYFNKRTKRMEGFAQINPYNKGELIQVHFENWKKSDDGLWLFTSITILQGPKQKFKFDYTDIAINPTSFRRLKEPQLSGNERD